MRSCSLRFGVLVADDQPIFRDALADVVRNDPALELLGVTASGDETREAAVAHAPDVVVVAESLLCAAFADASGGQFRAPRLLVLADSAGPSDPYAAVEAGAIGYLSKDASVKTLRAAILATAQGRTLLDIAARDELARAIRLRGRDERPVLSPRETEVLGLIAEGHTAPQIAGQLQVARTTVRTHMLHLYDKLGVTERAAAVAEAMRRGLLE